MVTNHMHIHSCLLLACKYLLYIHSIASCKIVLLTWKLFKSSIDSVAT